MSDTTPSRADQLRSRVDESVARGRRVSVRAAARSTVKAAGGEHEALAAVFSTMEPTPELMIRAYTTGCYLTDWGGRRFEWESPVERGVSPLEGFHIPKHARRLIRKGELETHVDRDFGAVMRACADAPRREMDGTWLSPRLQEFYLELHERGYAHCVGVYDGDELVAGIFGTGLGGVYSSETSFTTVPNASKVAYAHLHFGLQAAGYQLLDIQQVSPMTASFGGHLISREDYLERLSHAVVANPTFPDTAAMVAATRIGVGLDPTP